MATGYPKVLYDNRLKDATPAASTTDTGYNVLNLRDWRNYTWWKPTALPATVTVDCASAKSADYCAVWGHDLYTQGATIEVRGSTDNFSASDVLVATLTPTGDDPLLIQFTAVSYRYWRIRLTGATMPSLAIAAIGTALEIPAYFGEGFDPVGRKFNAQFNRSENGNPLGTVLKHKEWESSLKFDLVSGTSGWTWLRDTWDAAVDAHLSLMPWVLAWDPEGHGSELFLLDPIEQYDAPHKAGQYLDLSFKVSGLRA